MSSHPVDPVNLTPIPALWDSYVYHSAPHEDTSAEGWIMGIDEAGRGPVLGPMVYAAAYCPVRFKKTLEGLGFDDSKALSVETRQNLWEAFDVHPELCYSSATLSPQSISAGMLRKNPVNLNQQAQDATIGLIQSALDRNFAIRECYVDALGPSPQYQAKLSALFPSISFTVCPKADSLFKIVGAASIIAKVTRDRYIHHWIDPEDTYGRASSSGSTSVGTVVGSGKARDMASVVGDEEQGNADKMADVEMSEVEAVVRGSGYPSDPKTQAYLKDGMDPVFGYKGIVRFSWATVKVLLDKNGVECRWIDDVAQPSAASWFGSEADTGRPKVWREIGVSGVGEL